MDLSTRTAGLLLAAALFVSVAASAGEIAWAPLDIAAAMQKATAEGKLVHIFVEGDNCPPCDAFKKTHLQDPAYIDFISTVFVNIRAHEGDPASSDFLRSLSLNHPMVPRYYILGPDGAGLSMSVGMVMAPPMQAAEVLSMTAGYDLPVNKQAAAALAGRLRSHAASRRASGAVDAENPLRPLGVAILEAQAWALAGRLDEAENALGRQWVDHLADQEIRSWYINFWLRWNRNLDGALKAAEVVYQTSPEDPNSVWLMASALAANQRYAEALPLGESLLSGSPDNPGLAATIEEWRGKAGR